MPILDTSTWFYNMPLGPPGLVRTRHASCLCVLQTSVAIGVTPPGTVANVLARVRFTMVSIRTTAGCRIIGEAYHKIPSTLQLRSHDTMITGVPSPLTSRPSGLDNYEFLEVLFTSKLSCISLNNKKIIRSFGYSNPLRSWTRQNSLSRSNSCANC